jgi:hypothetical protein
MENTDKNYVDKWLDQQMLEYEHARGKHSAMMVLKSIQVGFQRWNRLGGGPSLE